MSNEIFTLSIFVTFAILAPNHLHNIVGNKEISFLFIGHMLAIRKQLNQLFTHSHHHPFVRHTNGNVCETLLAY